MQCTAVVLGVLDIFTPLLSLGSSVTEHPSRTTILLAAPGLQAASLWDRGDALFCQMGS